MIEKWKLIFGGYYAVSNFGRVKRMKPGPRTYVGKILKVTYGEGRYGSVSLSAVKEQQTIDVHVLVAREFIGPCPPGKEVNHKDGIKRHNEVKNLEYLTSKGNSKHAIRLGLIPQGEACPASKLTNKAVREILTGCIPWSRKVSVQKFATRFGVEPGTIRNVLKRRSWKYVK